MVESVLTANEFQEDITRIYILYLIVSVAYRAAEAECINTVQIKHTNQSVNTSDDTDIASELNVNNFMYVRIDAGRGSTAYRETTIFVQNTR